MDNIIPSHRNFAYFFFIKNLIYNSLTNNRTLTGCYFFIFKAFLKNLRVSEIHIFQQNSSQESIFKRRKNINFMITLDSGNKNYYCRIDESNTPNNEKNFLQNSNLEIYFSSMQKYIYIYILNFILFTYMLLLVFARIRLFSVLCLMRVLIISPFSIYFFLLKNDKNSFIKIIHAYFKFVKFFIYMFMVCSICSV